MQIGGLDSTIYELSQDHLTSFPTFSIQASNHAMKFQRSEVLSTNDITALRFQLV
jgi:hypothetical protein